MFVFRSVFSSSPGHLPVSTILPFSLCHAAEVLYFLEGSFYTCLVPRFCSCCPGDTPQWPGPRDQRVCAPGSQGTITMGKFALSRLPTTSRTLYRWPTETQPSLCLFAYLGFGLRARVLVWHAHRGLQNGSPETRLMDTIFVLSLSLTPAC